jgi:hypothetical protein
MGTAHGANELGLCPHGLACQAGVGPPHRFCLGYGHIWKIQTRYGRQKYSARPITLSRDGILTNGLLRVKRGMLEMQIAVLREEIAQRARELLAHTYGANFFLFTFRSSIMVNLVGSIRSGILVDIYDTIDLDLPAVV